MTFSIKHILCPSIPFLTNKTFLHAGKWIIILQFSSFYDIVQNPLYNKFPKVSSQVKMAWLQMTPRCKLAQLWHVNTVQDPKTPIWFLVTWTLRMGRFHSFKHVLIQTFKKCLLMTSWFCSWMPFYNWTLCIVSLLLFLMWW